MNNGFYNEISEVVRNYAYHRDTNERFLLSTPQRLLTSSLAAASAWWAGRTDAIAHEAVEEHRRRPAGAPSRRTPPSRRDRPAGA